MHTNNIHTTTTHYTIGGLDEPEGANRSVPQEYRTKEADEVRKYNEE